MLIYKDYKKGDNDMLTTYKVKAKKLSGGMQVETKSRSFKLLIDEPEVLGGTNKAMSPVEALLCALGGCQAIVASAYAASEGVSFEEFYVEIEGDLDTDGFLRKSDVRPGFQEIRYKMHFKTSEPRDKIEKFVKLIEHTCPVGDSLENKVTLINAGVVLDYKI